MPTRKKIDEKELQERYFELQMISNTMQEMQATIQQLDQQLVEIASVKGNLDSLAEQKVGSDMLVPVSNGIFVKGALKDNKELIVNVGSSIAVKKTIPETKQILDERMQELEGYRNSLLAELERVAVRAKSLESEIIGMMPQE